jgi:hypothetical protein
VGVGSTAATLDIAQPGQPVDTFGAMCSPQDTSVLLQGLIAKEYSLLTPLIPCLTGSGSVTGELSRMLIEEATERGTTFVAGTMCGERDTPSAAQPNESMGGVVINAPDAKDRGRAAKKTVYIKDFIVAVPD